MNKKIKSVFLLIIIALSGWFFFNSQHPDNHKNEIILFGNIDIREAKLSFNGSEHIKAILVEEGDRVKQGQELAFLHTELLQANAAQAKAMEKAQKQVLAALVAGTRPEEIRKIKADLQAAQAKEKAARATAVRLTQLQQQKLAAPDEVEHAQSLANEATAQADAAQAALDLAIAGPRKEDIAQARAILLARQAEYIRAMQHLKNAILYASSNGIIRNRILQVGDMVTPQTPVLTLALTNPIWVRAYLSESQLGKIKPGMQATIRTDSFPDKSYPGWIGYISPTAEFTPKNIETSELRTHLVYQIRIYACDNEYELRLGMPATVTIPLNQSVTPASPIKNSCDQP